MSDNIKSKAALVETPAGDGIAFKVGKSVISVSGYGRVCKKRSCGERKVEAALGERVGSLLDFKLGGTYCIYGSPHKLVDGTLFDMKFLVLSSDGAVFLKSVGYDELADLCRSRPVYRIEKKG